MRKSSGCDNALRNKSLIGTLLEARFPMAPLAGITDRPFRMMVRKFGCRFAFTEMVDVNGLLYNNLKTSRLVERSSSDDPLGVQIVGRDVKKVSEVGRMLQDMGFGLIDLNCGCPARKVVKAGKGAALLKEPEVLARLVGSLRRAVDVALTVKIRSGWRRHDHVRTVRLLNDEGADAIWVHPRTREQGFKGPAEHKIIAEAKQASSVPVLASGGLFTAEDAIEVLDETGADGAFIARGALGTPWIFNRIYALLSGESYRQTDLEFRKETFLEHFSISVSIYGFERASKRMHKHLGWYLKGYKNLHEVLSAYRARRCSEDVAELLLNLRHDERTKRLYFKSQ